MSHNRIWDFEKNGDQTVILDDRGRVFTYRQLSQEAECLVSAIGRRCLVFILCRNEIGSLLGYAACLNEGIVPVMFSDHLDREQLAELLAVYHPAYIWLPEDMGEMEVRPSVGDLSWIFDMEEVYRSWGYRLLQTGYQKEYPLYDELALLLTTSGSTGSPKLVRQSYENIRANAGSIAEYLELTETEKPITTLPMNYTYGLSIINSHLLVGATILVTDKTLMQKEFWSFFTEAGATSFGGVPYTYEMLEKLRFSRMKLPTLRTFTQAGGKLTPELHEKLALYAKETGKRFVVMYGQCEATARMGYLPPEKAVEKKGSMGIPIPGGAFRLVDENGGTITEPFQTGELVYEGQNVTLGYAEAGEDLIKGDERKGVLSTGDMAQFDEDGYYYIVGRKKRFLKIYGNRVNLDEIDRMIKGAFQFDAVSTGKDDNMVIFVTDESMVHSVREYVIQKTKLNPAAFEVKYIEEIPKNEAGKVLYKELAKNKGGDTELSWKMGIN